MARTFTFDVFGIVLLNLFASTHSDSWWPSQSSRPYFKTYSTSSTQPFLTATPYLSVITDDDFLPIEPRNDYDTDYTEDSAEIMEDATETLHNQYINHDVEEEEEEEEEDATKEMNEHSLNNYYDEFSNHSKSSGNDESSDNDKSSEEDQHSKTDDNDKSSEHGESNDYDAIDAHDETKDNDDANDHDESNDNDESNDRNRSNDNNEAHDELKDSAEAIDHGENNDSNESNSNDTNDEISLGKENVLNQPLPIEDEPIEKKSSSIIGTDGKDEIGEIAAGTNDSTSDNN